MGIYRVGEIIADKAEERTVADKVVNRVQLNIIGICYDESNASNASNVSNAS